MWLSLHQEPVFEQELRPTAEELRLWNGRLSEPYAMAPTRLRNAGLITPEQAVHENLVFAQHSTGYLLKQLGLVRQELGEEADYGWVVHIGTGKGDDLGYIPKALEWDFRVLLIDCCGVAKKQAKAVLKKIPGLRELTETEGKYPPIFLKLDAMKYCTNEYALNPEETMLVYVSRVFQHWPRDKFPKKFDKTMSGLGKFLLEPGRRLVIIHLFAENNPKNEWITSYPFTREDFLSGLNRDTGSTYRIQDEENFPFYDQVYTAFTVVASG